MTVFLKMKAWQLFSLIIILPYILIIVSAILTMVMEVRAAHTVISLINGILVAAVALGWCWTVGTRLNDKIDKNKRPPSTLFRSVIIYLIVYSLTFLFVFSLSAFFISDNILKTFVLLQFITIIVIIYAAYFIARNLSIVEQKPAAGFGDFAGTFFLVLFYPIGIWFIQPRINRLFEFENAKDK